MRSRTSSSTLRCLFGKAGAGSLFALHLPLGEVCQYPVAPEEVAILLTRSGREPATGAVEVVTSPRDHEGVLIIFHRSLLKNLLEPFRPGIAAELRALLEKAGIGGLFAPDLPTEWATQLYADFVSPPLQGPAQSFYLEAKTKELIAHVCFVPSKDDEQEFFCSRQRRLNSDRITKSIDYLKAHLDEPLDLSSVAEAAGCSPSYLSRIFSSTTGFTLSQYFRKSRIEKAAEMLVTGQYSVSEVAIEVGYQSLSHFSKAFQAEKGCLPSRFEAA
ncbi:MAG: AraC family transcriptional regulator [Verrucomicrobiota bacterium]